MKKDFDEWNQVKKETDLRTDIDTLYFKEAEIWWCNLGVNIGFEQDGKGPRSQRPVLILKKFNKFVICVIPLSTKIKKDNKYYVDFLASDNVLRSGIISQIRLIDTKRLTEKIAVTDKNAFEEMKKAVRNMFS